MSDEPTTINYSVIVLILVGIVSLIGIIFTVAIAIASQNEQRNKSSNNMMSVKTVLPIPTDNNSYPYLYSFNEDFLKISLLFNPTIFQDNHDISYIFSPSHEIKIGNIGRRAVSRDIIHDDLVTTITQKYNEGSITIPLAKGCPYITIEINDLPISIKIDEPFLLNSENNEMFIIRFDEVSGYILFLSSPLDIIVVSNIITIPNICGVIRLAYFNSNEMFDILVECSNIYPVASSVTINNFIWKTRYFGQSPNTKLLMFSLPHHNITNTTNKLPVDCPLYGTRYLVTTNNNIWDIQNDITIGKFESYKLLNKEVWEKELYNVSLMKPSNDIDRIKWLNDLSTLLLFGTNCKYNIDNYKYILDKETKNIKIIGNTGGYLLFIYAVNCYIDNDFMKKNKGTINKILVDTLNNINKDMYSGLSSSFDINNNKVSKFVGEHIHKYYAMYLLSQILNEEDIKEKSLILLTSEILAFEYYFLPKIITERDNSSYSYKTVGNTNLDKSASSLISIIKPITPITLLFKDRLKGRFTITDEAIVPESLAYIALTLSDDVGIKLVSNVSDDVLPYGSTWSQILYYLEH